MIKTLHILTIILSLFAITANSQSTIILRGTALGYHPFSDVNRELYKENKIDANANFIVEPGIIIGMEKYIRGNFLSLQLLSGMYSDAAAMQAGFTSLSFRRQFYHKYKHHFSASLGGALLYRKDWHSITAYRPVEDFNLNGKWQNKWTFTSELNYNYYITKRLDIELSFLYGHQYKTFTPTLGIRFWVNPDVKVAECDCHKRFSQGRYRKIFRRLFR